MFSSKLIFRLSLFLVSLGVIAVLALVLGYQSIRGNLPQIVTVADYKPLLVAEVYDRNEKKIGEFFRERRTLVPYDKMPKKLVQSFVAAEDDQFFEHSGINYVAILRAALANLRAGQTVQGASTITQQVAKTLMLTPERTITRKIREALLAQQMEENLTKEEILFLYLNQIYFGQGAYGIQNAAQTYFRKEVEKLTVAEMAMLAGLPKAPSAYSPVSNPARAKERQSYVLRRMADVGFITPAEADAAIKEPIKVFVRERYEQYAPYFLETVRLLLVAQLGENVVLDQGIRIHTSLDIEKQKAAQEAVARGLKDLDKRQGYRGALKNLTDAAEIEKLIEAEKKKLLIESTPERIILSDGKFAPLPAEAEAPKGQNHPLYMTIGQTVQGIVTAVDDSWGYVSVRLAGATGVIDIDTMKWARKPNPDKRADLDQIQKPSQALNVGDVILVKVASNQVTLGRTTQIGKGKQPKGSTAPSLVGQLALELDQEPEVEGALMSFDQQNQDVLAMVGGYDFGRNEFNRALQAARQTGSSFKALVYAAALDKGYNPSTPVMDVPLVYEETKDDEEGQGETSVWKPSNHGKSYGGEITFRNALVRSLNIPTVKIIEDISVPWAADYARRFGIFSPLNMDFTLALGSSSVTLYEMTKAFAQFGRLGKKLRPMIIRKVVDRSGKDLLQNITLDLRFEKEMAPLEEDFEKRRKAYFENKAANPDQQPEVPTTDAQFFHENPDQLIKPQTAFVMTSLLKGVVEDPRGTAGRAAALGRDIAGKTGTTNGYFDAWFIGYSAQVSTGVWVGFDQERSLGKGEVGGRSALPIWVDYMKAAHESLPQMTLPAPEGIVFANIDSETGKLASSTSRLVLRQAFAEGTEPSASSSATEEATDFYKQDLTE